ncbi:MAG: winged helix DNA-binding domain-containing protein [Gorillibacterium sp.]|nr:winged helix DNA-binding domain-containing protein [Gorillibacterium sp.]
MTPRTISKADARRFLLAYHGLTPNYELKTKEDILSYISKVGCIQYDPLNVVGQNADLVLQSRVADYNRNDLRELLYTDRKLIDFWDKNMSICPVDSWPYYSRFRQGYQGWCNENAATVSLVRSEIERNGALCSGDFDLNEKVSWYYGPTRLARAALEGMYYSGDLIIHHKVGTRKYYDLAERHISSKLLKAVDPNSTEVEYHDWLVHRRIGSIGLLWNRPSDAWLGIGSFKVLERTQAFQRLLEKGQIIQIQIADLATPFYIRTEDEPLLEQTLTELQSHPSARILAPLDNMLWDRKLIQVLFDFEYRWEVYKPVVERTYGYYVLPVVYGDRIVARLEPEKHRSGDSFVIKNWWWEAGVEVNDEIKEAMRECFSRFAAYLGTNAVKADFLE